MLFLNDLIQSIDFRVQGLLGLLGLLLVALQLILYEALGLSKFVSYEAKLFLKSVEVTDLGLRLLGLLEFLLYLLGLHFFALKGILKLLLFIVGQLDLILQVFQGLFELRNFLAIFLCF